MANDKIVIEGFKEKYKIPSSLKYDGTFYTSDIDDYNRGLPKRYNELLKAYKTGAESKDEEIEELKARGLTAYNEGLDKGVKHQEAEIKRLKEALEEVNIKIEKAQNAERSIHAISHLLAGQKIISEALKGGK